MKKNMLLKRGCRGRDRMVVRFTTHFQQYFSYIVAASFIGGETAVPEENNRPVASH
jgi:hypothetical protein